LTDQSNPSLRYVQSVIIDLAPGSIRSIVFKYMDYTNFEYFRKLDIAVSHGIIGDIFDDELE